MLGICRHCYSGSTLAWPSGKWWHHSFWVVLVSFLISSPSWRGQLDFSEWDESGLPLASSYVQPFPRNLPNTMPFWDMPLAALAALASCMSTKMAKTASSEISSDIHHLWTKKHVLHDLSPILRHPVKKPSRTHWGAWPNDLRPMGWSWDGPEKTSTCFPNWRNQFRHPKIERPNVSGG